MRPASSWNARPTRPAATRLLADHGGAGGRAALPVEPAPGYPGCRARGADRGRAGRARLVPPGSRGDGCGIRASAGYPRASRSAPPLVRPSIPRIPGPPDGRLLRRVPVAARGRSQLGGVLRRPVGDPMVAGPGGDRRGHWPRAGAFVDRPPVGCVAAVVRGGGGYAGEPLDALAATIGGGRAGDPHAGEPRRPRVRRLGFRARQVRGRPPHDPDLGPVPLVEPLVPGRVPAGRRAPDRRGVDRDADGPGDGDADRPAGGGDRLRRDRRRGGVSPRPGSGSESPGPPPRWHWSTA